MTGIALLSPALAAGAVLSKLQSPGRVFFLGERVGRRGKPFRIVKFRTMIENAPHLGAAITTADDIRVTRIGRFLRRMKLDELPNLLNVLNGSMSIVGPRPETPNYVALYSGRERRVLSVRPGMTGPSQLELPDEEELLAAQSDPEAYYVETLIPRKLALDLEYVRTRTMSKDIGYVVKTGAVVLKRAFGARQRNDERLRA